MHDVVINASSVADRLCDVQRVKELTHRNIHRRTLIVLDFLCFFTVFRGRVFELLFRIEVIIGAEWKSTTTPLLTDASSRDMVKMTTPTQSVDGQTQYGNARYLDPSDCIFVFKNTLSDYEEPPSDEEVSTNNIYLLLRSLFSFYQRRFNKAILHGEVIRLRKPHHTFFEYPGYIAILHSVK